MPTAMHVERLLREVEQKLEGHDELRSTVLDALREAIARERRGDDPSLTVEVERERRLEAEEMLEALEAIHRPASVEEALVSAVKQATRALDVDSAAITAREPLGGHRVLTALGNAGTPLVGTLLSGPAVDELAALRTPSVVADTEEPGGRPWPLPIAARAWAALPMLHEGQLVGLLLVGRDAPSTFSEEALHRGRRIAFAAAAVIARHRQLEQTTRYARMLEQIVAVDHRAFHSEPQEALAQALLEGACTLSGSRGGLFVLQTPRGPQVVGAVGEGFVGALGRSAPADLASAAVQRLGPARMLEAAEALGVALPTAETWLVPLATDGQYLGSLALLDAPDMDDRLLEAYAARAAVAWSAAQLRRRADTSSPGA